MLSPAGLWWVELCLVLEAFGNTLQAALEPAAVLHGCHQKPDDESDGQQVDEQDEKKLKETKGSNTHGRV